MAIPTVAGVGADNAGTTGAVTYTLPTHQANDILVLVVETNVTGGVSAPAGWAHITNSPRAQGSNVTSVSVMWLRAASSSETNPQVSGAADHQTGFAAAFRGCVTTGDPWDFTPVGSGNASGANMSATGGTTTVVDCLVLICSGNQTDLGTDNYSAISNGSLANLAIQNQAPTLNGNGGGAMLATGEKATTGATGTTTATIGTAGATANLVFALKPATSSTVNGVAAAAFGFTGTAAGVDRALGQAAASFGFTATGLGVPTTQGVAAGSFGFTAAAAGIPSVLGAAAALLGFTGTASGSVGAPAVTGAATAAFGFTGAAAGVDRALGAALASLGFTGTALGVDRAVGTASAAFGFTGAAAGVPRVVGVATAFGFTATASGYPQVLGVAVAAFGFTGAAAGTGPAIADPYPVTLTIRERATVTIRESATATVRERATATVRETSA